MSTYNSPGVYVENNDKVSVNTDAAIGVAGFVGIAERGTLNKAVRINSWNQFISEFAAGMESPFIASADLAYAVYGFFQNGGSDCIIVRTAHNTATKANLVAVDGFTAVMTAKDEGEWANKMTVKVSASEDVEGHFDLSVMLSGNTVETLRTLSNTVGGANYWVDRVTTESAFLIGVSGELSATVEALTFTSGADGVKDIEDSDFVNALTAFDEYSDTVCYIAIPGQTTQNVLSGLTKYCYEGSNIIPILEAPKTANTAAVKALRKANENFTGVLLWPWGNVTDPLSKSPTNNLRPCPPSGHYMGVMSRIAAQRGVWKAPAGVEAVVKGFVSLVTNVTKNDTDVLNPIGVVFIQAQTNYGICVFGSRSLNSTNKHFKYVSDLVLDAYIKRQAYILGLPYVFEGNKEDTWETLQTVISAFMDGLMRKGAFQGSTKEDSYYVKCDADLNAVHVQKKDGIIETEIGYANVKPGEFIVIKVSHDIGK